MTDREQARRDMVDAARKLAEGAKAMNEAAHGRPVPKPPKGFKAVMKGDGTVEFVPQ